MSARVRRVLYASGTFGSSLLQQTMLLWTFYFFAPPPSEGLPTRVSPALVGVALGLGRLVDALVDPAVAYWSDRQRGRGGRRRPFILIGAPLLGVVFAAVWRPPDATPTMANFVFLSVLLGLFYLLFTLVLNPYMALLAEVTRSGRDRVVTSAWQAAFSLSGTAAAFIVSSYLAAHVGFATMGLVLAPVGVIPLLLAGLAVRERMVDDHAPDFAASARTVFGDPRFRVFIAGFALLWLGLSTVSLSTALIVTVLMGLPRAAVGGVLGVSVVATLLAMPASTRLAHRLGAHRTLLGAMTLTAVLLPPLAGVGRWPGPLSPAAQGYVIVALAGPALATLFALPNTLLADIAQAVARERRMRIEGMFFAFQGLILNGATSLASGLLGGLLAGLGYETGLRAAPLVAAACVLGAIGVFRRLPAPPSGQSPIPG